ncbi:hypothetical protein GUITHDRAFT_162858 [Guillardia theta CCMP2712]|uniref:C2 domain-containing protein n=1 Tax=Guillardia theta (strain CCMP2712) TaxID=905079 RepID=L1JEL0_GUITC|nr:hypothetical protein GUITHDRAFT_162858 [Guillardia theta CCMP2712]EKX46968.1 hypothetical protein GUITHDRAFT_162858 [Guillardia theta CCMP2712]|eukprot:XP_005833948.1 hypothetical protein GUITHDRAFT_162858 [Guillardia theta CCMP2712]
MLLRSAYAPFREPLATLSSQYSPSKEFIGGRSDWIPESSKAFRTQIEKKRAVRLGAAPVQLAKEIEEDRYLWKELLPRRQYKALVWVTIHGAENLMPKIIGTRDPYVKIQLGNQVEKTTPKLNSMNPRWEETFAMFASDVLNEEVVLTVHQDDVSRGYHVRDDEIGTYSFSLKQLQSMQDSRWTGKVSLKQIRTGIVHATLRMETLTCAVNTGIQRENSGLDDKDLLGGLASPILISQPIKNIKGIVQIKVLKAKCSLLPGNEQKTLHPFIQLKLNNQVVDPQVCKPSDEWSLQSAETRVVRGTYEPQFNEYFEFMVRDPFLDKLELVLQSKDGFFGDKVGGCKLQLYDVLVGKYVKKWVDLKSESKTKYLASLFVETKLAMIEWEGQEPKATAHFNQHIAELEAKRRMEEANADKLYGNIASVDEEDSEWALLVDLSKKESEGPPDAAAPNFLFQLPVPPVMEDGSSPDLESAQQETSAVAAMEVTEKDKDA